MKKIFRVVKFIYGISFIMCSIGMLFQTNSSEFKGNVFSKIFASIFFAILAYLLLRKPTRKSEHINNYPTSIFPNISTDEHPAKQSNQPIVNETYISDKDTICRTESKTIVDDEIPNLTESGYKQAVTYEQKSSNPKFHRTEREEDLEYNFISKYSEQVHLLEDKFEDAYRNADQLENLNSKIKQYELTSV